MQTAKGGTNSTPISSPKQATLPDLPPRRPTPQPHNPTPSSQLPPHPKSSPASTPTTRRLAPRQPIPFAPLHPHHSQDPYNRSGLAHIRPPSPSTAAAAMSLGALAAAASMAAAAVPVSSPTHAAAYSLAHMQHNFPLLPPPARDDQGAHNTQPGLSPRAPLMSQGIAPHPAQGFLDPHSQVPPVLKPLPNAHIAHQKGSNAKPVAPAPSSAMHPSQMSVNTHPNGKPKQRRYRASPEQLRQLIARFDMNPSPSSAELQEMATKISMPAQSVVLWFKNRRARVPHKMAEKAVNAKRRETGDLPVASGGIAKTSRGANTSKKQAPSGNAQNIPPTVKRSPSFSAEAAAASMAEMAMALAAGKVPVIKSARQAGRNITNQGISRPKQAESQPVRGPSQSSPPPHRPKAESVLPYDTNLVKRLGSNASNHGAEFVQASPTPRRPRTIPPTPRVFSQKEYNTGEKVEVLEMEKGVCRAWYSATVVGREGLRDLSLGENAAVACGLFNTGSEMKSEGIMKQTDRADVKGDNDDINGDGGDSPRTVRSPVATPTPPMAKVEYSVRFENRFENDDTSKPLEAEVLATQLRPAAPHMFEKSPCWKPDIGGAVEVLRDGAWFVAVAQNFVLRKGYLVSFESGDVEWVRRPRLRPYQIWRGGDDWVTKTKAPRAVSRKSAGLSVTHPPGGKRKRSEWEGQCGSGRERRGRSKRGRNGYVDRSGPDGLPEGWRIDYLNYIGYGGGKEEMFYIAPDGYRLRSLKEAQLYVKLMGPV